MFVYQTIIRLQHTDAAGLIFYARLFDFAHEAYEAFLDEIGHPLPTELSAQPIMLPIAHASADYKAPLRLNDRLSIELEVARVGRRSFELEYRFLRAEGTPVAVARTVHVAIDPSTAKSVSLPEALSRGLRPHCPTSSDPAD